MSADNDYVIETTPGYLVHAAKTLPVIHVQSATQKVVVVASGGTPGRTGLRGQDGEAGEPGPPGADGPPGAPLVWRGVWDNETTYSKSDLVSFVDPEDNVEKAYGAIADGQAGADPTNTSLWRPVPVIAGEPGPPGPKGDPGSPLVWRGAWDSGTSYSISDVVSFIDPDTGVNEMYGAIADSAAGIDPTDVSRWRPISLLPPGDGGGGTTSHKILEWDTGPISAGGEINPDLFLGYDFKLLSIESTRSVRITLYTTDAHRDSDEGRLGTDPVPTGDHGIVFDGYFDASETMDPHPNDFQGIPIAFYIGTTEQSLMFYGSDTPPKESPSDNRHGMRAQLDVITGGALIINVAVGNSAKSDMFWEVRTFDNGLIGDSHNSSFFISPGSYMFHYTQPDTYDGGYDEVISVDPPVSVYHDRPAYDTIAIVPISGAVIREPQFGVKPVTVSFSPPLEGVNGDDPPSNYVYARITNPSVNGVSSHITFSVISTEV